jgi:hypothetical protein
MPGPNVGSLGSEAANEDGELKQVRRRRRKIRGRKSIFNWGLLYLSLNTSD